MNCNQQASAWPASNRLRWVTMMVLAGLMVAACGTSTESAVSSARPIPSAADGVLDCSGGNIVQDAGIVVSGDTEEFVARAALDRWIAPLAKRHEGDIVVPIRLATGSLVVNQREVVVARASEVPAGGWVVDYISGCAGFER